MLDQATVATIQGYISTVGDTIDATLGNIDPQLHVPIVIGTAIAKAAPQLVADVEAWLDKAKSGTTTDAEDATIAAKIAALMLPEGPGLA